MINVVKVLAKEHIKRAVKEWGIEGTEDKIKELYQNMPQARDFILQELREVYHYGKTSS